MYEYEEWSWTPDETGMTDDGDDDPGARCACGRTAFEMCCSCGTALCPMCFETGAGFCGHTDCLTDERIDAMNRELRGEEDHPHA